MRIPLRPAGAQLVVLVALAAGVWRIPAVVVSAAATAQLQGIVTLRGHALPDVVVTVHRAGEGTLGTAKTAADGRYTFDALLEGVYSVDFDWPQAHVGRVHGVRIPAAGPVEANFDLALAAICECVIHQAKPGEVWTTLSGTLQDQAGRPVPHVALELRGGPREASAYSGLDGEFRAHVRVGDRLTLVASDISFVGVSREVTIARTNVPIIIKLAPRDTQPAPASESLRRTCRCMSDIFVHDRR